MEMIKCILACILLLQCMPFVIMGEDFYEVLGVDRQSNLRDIRKAFKKLALQHHPDKNTEDPNAHEKFLKINRAYEVLKDEELRKKYDMYGEEGLKEDGPTGRGYKSWKFYNHDFGIYDDDLEIITLSKSDFETSVEGTSDVWFINFYSPQCGHCHELAPTWREMARELEGVIRIGAVNCGDDWMLCRQQGIRSYPSLLMYPSKEKYYGERTTSALVKHCLKQVRAQVAEMWSGNFNSIIQDEEKVGKPWVISFCGDGGDCLQRSSVIKLAAMMDEVVNIGEVNCHSNEKLCDELGVEHGTHYFPTGKVDKENAMGITTLDPKEIAFIVLEQQPDVTELDKNAFLDAMSQTAVGEDTPWLIHFVEASSHDLELRKLPLFLNGMNVGRVDCRQMKDECLRHHIIKTPTFAVYKEGGGYEIHHGRLTAHDIAAFARESAQTPVSALGPEDFPHRVVDSRDPWFVDFFAPWCPPCMRLLPEFRKASRQMSNVVQFGTVDCTIHTSLCQKYNIHSYPTTIFYNQSVPHHFSGHHSVGHIIEFIKDTLQPPVLTLDSANFDSLVSQKSPDDIWLVDYYAPWCGPCQQLAPEWRRLAKDLKDHPHIHVGQVDCQANGVLCQRMGVRSYPSVRLYPMGQSSTNKFFSYNGWFRDAQSMKAWAFEYLPSKAEDLTWETFNSEVLRGTEPWIVDFFAPWCGHCQVFAPEFETVAQEMEGIVRAGKVDCDKHQNICRKAGIQAYPSVRFYKGSEKPGYQQSVYGEDINSQSGSYIIQFLKRRVSSSSSKKRRATDEL